MTGFDLLSNFTDDPESLVKKARTYFGSLYVRKST
jgi:hypothetical protein